MIEINYKGEIIRFNEERDLWYWGEVFNQSQKALKSAIDKFQKSKFETVQAFIRRDSYGRRKDGDVYEVITVTSQSDPNNFWIKDAEGRRSKEFSHYLYSHTDANKALIEKINTNRKAVQKLDDEYDKLYNALEKFKSPVIMEK